VEFTNARPSGTLVLENASRNPWNDGDDGHHDQSSAPSSAWVMNALRSNR
jgi:hypothetical protein